MERGEKTVHDLVTTFTRSLRQRDEQVSIGLAADLAQFVSELHDLVAGGSNLVVPMPEPTAVVFTTMPEAPPPPPPSEPEPKQAAPEPVAAIPLSPTAKLAKRDAGIMQLLKEGLTVPEVAERFGMKQSTVRCVVRKFRHMGVDIKVKRVKRVPWTEEQKRKAGERMKQRLQARHPAYTRLYPVADKPENPAA